MRNSLHTFIIALGLCALQIRAEGAIPSQPVYKDVLQNGWQNWSWAATNLSAKIPVHSGRTSIAVTAGPWQALYLSHAAFESTAFASLSFWINGGPSGGQRLRVQALLSGTAQPGVAIGPLSANTWTPVTVTVQQLSVAGQPDFDGFWLQNDSGSSIPTFYVDDILLNPNAAPATVHLNVDAASPIRVVDARMFGVNAAIWDSSFDTATTKSLLLENGNQALRFPGGSLSDEYHWATNTTLSNTWTWATSTDKFADVATATGARIFITANYGTGTPQEAAGWVQYANVTNGWGFKYWEIGNECYGTWETDYRARPHDPYSYAQATRDYITQMKAVDPTIKVGVVLVTGEDSFANYTDHPAINPRTGAAHNGWTPVMLATLRSLGVTPDFVIYHKYQQGPGGEWDMGLLLSARTWAQDVADLRQQLNDYLGTAGPGVEIVCTENNSVYSNPGKQTTSLVNGLFLADSIGQALQTELASLVWWDLRNGQETGNSNATWLYGWRKYGDYGIVSPSRERYPVFYASKLLQYFARGGDTMVRATSDFPLLSAYAARRTDGSLALLVINKTSSTMLKASIQLTGFTPAASATYRRYGIAQDNAAKTSPGSAAADIQAGTITTAAATFTYTFPAYSATVFTLHSP